MHGPTKYICHKLIEQLVMITVVFEWIILFSKGVLPGNSPECGDLAHSRAGWTQI
jgi:hypothetical protein